MSYVLPQSFSFSGEDVLDEKGEEARNELVRHLAESSTHLQSIPLEQRIDILDEAARNAEYNPDASIPYSDEMQMELFASLMHTLRRDSMYQALLFSTDYIGAPSPESLFVEGSSLQYPDLGLFVQPRNADVLTEPLLHLVAGLPILVKGSPMTLALAKEMQDTPLGDSMAVLDWTSGTGGDDLYNHLPQNISATLFGSIQGVHALKQMLPSGAYMRERAHRRSISYWDGNTDIGAMTRAITFLEGNGCLTPSIGFADKPLSYMSDIHASLKEAAEVFPYDLPFVDYMQLQRQGKVHALQAKTVIDRNAGGVMAVFNGDIIINPQGYRTATLMKPAHSYEGWLDVFAEMNEQLRTLAIKGLGGGGCGGGAQDRRPTQESESVINEYFNPAPAYKWVQTLAGNDVPPALRDAFIHVGGRRIVTPDKVLPNHAIPVDGELPIPLDKAGNTYFFAQSPRHMTLLNDAYVIADNGRRLSQPYEIPQGRGGNILQRLLQNYTG